MRCATIWKSEEEKNNPNSIVELIGGFMVNVLIVWTAVKVSVF